MTITSLSKCPLNKASHLFKCQRKNDSYLHHNEILTKTSTKIRSYREDFVLIGNANVKTNIVNILTDTYRRFQDQHGEKCLLEQGSEHEMLFASSPSLCVCIRIGRTYV